MFGLNLKDYPAEIQNEWTEYLSKMDSALKLIKSHSKNPQESVSYITEKAHLLLNSIQTSQKSTLQKPT